MSAQGSKGVYIVAFLLLASGLAYLVTSGLSQGSTPTLQVGQLAGMDAAELKKVRLYGKVHPQGVEMHEGNLGVSFVVADQVDPTLTVNIDFRGAVPDTFEPGVEVIVKGDYDSSNKVFRATQLTTKCPSKYEEQRPEGS